MPDGLSGSQSDRAACHLACRGATLRLRYLQCGAKAQGSFDQAQVITHTRQAACVQCKWQATVGYESMRALILLSFQFFFRSAWSRSSARSNSPCILSYTRVRRNTFASSVEKVSERWRNWIHRKHHKFLAYICCSYLTFVFFSGFYRKDHLRKHTRSHIARRVKSEVSAQNVSGSGANNAQNNSLHGSWGSYKDFW